MGWRIAAVALMDASGTQIERREHRDNPDVHHQPAKPPSGLLEGRSRFPQRPDRDHWSRPSHRGRRVRMLPYQTDQGCRSVKQTQRWWAAARSRRSESHSFCRRCLRRFTNWNLDSRSQWSCFLPVPLLMWRRVGSSTAPCRGRRPQPMPSPQWKRRLDSSDPERH